VQEAICNSILLGSYVETAAIAAGITKETFYAWLKQGNKAKEHGHSTKFSRFSDAVNKAMADATIRDLDRIDRAADSQWQAAAWKLERKHPQQWGRRVETTIQGPTAPGSLTPGPVALAVDVPRPIVFEVIPSREKPRA
jgi:hypothetical protein